MMDWGARCKMCVWVQAVVLLTCIHSHPNGDKAGNSDATMKANIMSFQYDFNLPIPQFSIYYQPEKKYLKY